MHTFTGRNGARIHFNGDGDGDGDAIITLDKSPGVEIQVSCEDLIDFVGSLVRRKCIANIEDMSNNELFGLNPTDGLP